MASARYKLDSITAIMDRNRIQATGPTKDIFDIPNLEEKWRAFGWNVLSVDGHDVGAILDVLDEAAAFKGGPTVIVAETVKGKGVSFRREYGGLPQRRHESGAVRQSAR
jgi:transketolase